MFVCVVCVYVVCVCCVYVLCVGVLCVRGVCVCIGMCVRSECEITSIFFLC